MSTTIVDPHAGDRSYLPPGGNPGWDDAYERWLGEFLDESAPRILDQLTDDRGDIPHGADRIVNKFSLSNHLYKWAIGWEFPSGTGPTFSHRLRFMSVQFHYRRYEVIVEADRYLREKVDQFQARLELASRGNRVY